MAVGLPAEARARRRATLRRAREWPIYAFLMACALLSVVTTFCIIVILVSESVGFFGEVSVLEFITGTEWTPLFINKSFGALPLLNATFMIALTSMLIAVPVGLAAAIYLSEYAAGTVRNVVKPVLEVLAGIPTVVYGYFALTFITPSVLQPLFGERVGVFNALSAAVAMAIMILPMVSSLSEDAMRAVPSALREGAYGLGANRFEVSTRVVLPAALSGIVAAVLLAVSRAVGETMIVVIAAGGIPNLSLNPFEAMQTMTAYIVAVSLGDTPHGTLEYSTIFAIGLMLFLATLVMNIVAQWLLARFREVYE